MTVQPDGCSGTTIIRIPPEEDGGKDHFSGQEYVT